MKNLLSFIIILTILPVLTVNLYSQNPGDINTDRPYQSKSPVTMPKNFFQIELGASVLSYDEEFTTYFHPEPFNAKAKYYSAPEVLLRYGITNNIEFRLGTEYNITNFSDNYYGYEQSFYTTEFGPIYAGTKINLEKESGLIPETAFLFNLSIPTTKYGNVNAGLRFAFQNNLNKVFNLKYNVGAIWDGGSSKIEQLLYTLSLGININKKLSAFAETFGYFESGRQPDNRLNGGFAYNFTKNISADIYSGICLNDYQPDYFLGAGISIRLPK